MKRRTISKALRWTFAVLAGLILLLAIHIYIVTRPGTPDASTRVMARIDVHQPLTAAESAAVTTWLYRQHGVDHVLCNPKTGIVVFTYSPLKGNANDIAASFKDQLHYPNSSRYIPTDKELEGGCPVASSSGMYKFIASIKKLF